MLKRLLSAAAINITVVIPLLHTQGQKSIPKKQPISAPAKKAATTPSPVPPPYTYDILLDSSKPFLGKKISHVIYIAMNDNGQITFSARLEPEGFALFTKDRLIAATGDALPNGNSALSLTNPSINNQGQIAFGATFRQPNCARCPTQTEYFVDNKVALSFRSPDSVRFHSWSIPQFNKEPLDPGEGRPEHDPVVTPDGKVLLNYQPSLSLNGTPILKRGTGEDAGWEMLAGDPIQVDPYPLPAVSSTGDGEIAFVGRTSGTGQHTRGIYLFTSKRGVISKWSHMRTAVSFGSDQSGYLQRPFINQKGDIAYLDQDGVLLLNGENPKKFNVDYQNIALFGFNDSRDQLIRITPPEDTIERLKVNDVVIAKRKGVVSYEGKWDITEGFPKLPVAQYEAFNLEYAALNNPGQVAFVANAYYPYLVDGKAGPKRAFIVLASPTTKKPVEDCALCTSIAGKSPAADQARSKALCYALAGALAQLGDYRAAFLKNPHFIDLFPTVYYNTTLIEMRRLSNGDFDHPLEKMEQMVAFFEAYKDNRQKYESGAAAEAHWKKHFEAAKRAEDIMALESDSFIRAADASALTPSLDVSTSARIQVQNVLESAITAHVEFDLARALRYSFDRRGNRQVSHEELNPDFVKTNQTLRLSADTGASELATATHASSVLLKLADIVFGVTSAVVKKRQDAWKIAFDGQTLPTGQVPQPLTDRETLYRRGQTVCRELHVALGK